MPVVTIRWARPEDLLPLRSIFDSWHPGLVALGGDFRRWLIAEVREEVVGGLLASEFSNWDHALLGYADLTDDHVVPFASLMCVAEHMRGDGIGTALMTYWIDSTPSWAHVVMPDASDDEPNRVRRVAFFERLGFRWMLTAFDEVEPWLMLRQTAPPRAV